MMEAHGMGHRLADLPDLVLGTVFSFLPATDLLLGLALTSATMVSKLQRSRMACRRIAAIPLQNFIKCEWWYVFVEVAPEPPYHHFDIQRAGGTPASFRVQTAEQVQADFCAWKQTEASVPRPRPELPRTVLVDRKLVPTDAKDIETALVSMMALSSAAFGQSSRAGKPGGGMRVTYRGFLQRCRLTTVRWSRGEQATSYDVFVDADGRLVVAEQAEVRDFLRTPWTKACPVGRPLPFIRPGIDLGMTSLLQQTFTKLKACPTYNVLLKVLKEHPKGPPPKPKVKAAPLARNSPAAVRFP
eukprot:EG_transcript_16313